jgi:hypothetical protein
MILRHIVWKENILQMPNNSFSVAVPFFMLSPFTLIFRAPFRSRNPIEDISSKYLTNLLAYKIYNVLSKRSTAITPQKLKQGAISDIHLKP